MDALLGAVRLLLYLTTDPANAEPVPLNGAQLWDCHGAQMYKFAAMVSRGEVEAEDLAQKALLRAIHALPRLQVVERKVDAWLWRIVVNTARDLGRMAKQRAILIKRLQLVGRAEPI